MKNLMVRIGAILLALSIAGCATSDDMKTNEQTTSPAESTMATEPTEPATAAVATNASQAPRTDNPLLAEWTGPYGGVPPFDKIRVEQFKPALEISMAENLADVERIAKDPAPPTFQNTIAALERAGRSFDRVSSIFGTWSSSMSTEDFQAVEQEMAPKLAAFSDQITQNDMLFRRIEAVYNSPAKSSLTPEEQRLAWRYYTNFVRAGSKLDPTAKAQLSELNQQLAGLFTKFAQNVLADENDEHLVLESDEDLAGLPQSLRDGAAEAAAEKKVSARGIITNTRSSVDPFLTYSDRRDLREKAWRMFVNRGDNGDAQDNNAILSDILQLRARRAHLLGYSTHAHWVLEDTMAKTPEQTMQLMEGVWPAAVARVHEEVADMEALAKRQGNPIDIQPWDYRYYMEKVRQAKYDLDQNEVKQYLQLDKLVEGIHWVAGQLFGFNFAPVNNLPVFHPDVKVWEVTDKETGRHIGLWYFDPYARSGKQSGAWMSEYRNQERFDGEITTIVSNNSNFVKGKPGEPVLISWDDAVALFHEFGHALHGLSSNVSYPSLAGTAVFSDYVEFPSQLLEHWLSTPEVLERFAVHQKTGKAIPKELLAKIDRTSKFNEGFATVEYLSSALVDMKLHLAGDQNIDPDAFEKKTLEELGMPDELVMRHRTPQFLHIFAGEGYAAGYYSYLWSDVLTADAAEAFAEAGGFYDQAMAQRLRQNVFSVGNTIDPAEGFRAFRGRDPRVEALMRKRGFPVSGSGASSTVARPRRMREKN